MPEKCVGAPNSIFGFPIRGSELVVGDLLLSELSARVGQTPFYAYDRNLISKRISTLRSFFPEEVKLHYAMKANPMPALVGCMVGWVDGIDVASGCELKVALDAGADPSSISFAGPGKRDSELFQAVASRVLINIESFREVHQLAHISRNIGRPARVAVRVNPDFELKGAGMKMGGGAKQFGVDVEQMPLLLSAIGDAGLDFQGFHLYAGSQNLNAHAICEAQNKSFELALHLARYAPSPIRFLNLGGGFGIPYFPGDMALDLEPIGKNLSLLVKRASEEMSGAKLVIELGRYLVGEAGIYVAQILDRKLSRDRVYLVVDGGMHHHLGASGNLGQVIRKNYPVKIGNKMDVLDFEIATVVGPLCTPLDLLADRMALPAAQAGDLVVVFQSGAYGLSASPNGFLSHPACLEVLV